MGALCDKRTSDFQRFFWYIGYTVRVMQNTTEMLLFAKELAEKAGATMRHYFDAANKHVEIKQDSSPVTIADKLINQLVIDRIAKAFPTHGVLAEEGSSHQDRSELWVCDPIDGTKGFIQGIPTAMFSLAFVVDGVPKVAVAYDPIQQKLYEAAEGLGAKLNGMPLHVSDHADLEGARVALLSRYEDLQKVRVLCDTLQEKGAKQLFVPGNVFRSSLVAAAKIDAHIFPGRSAHDVAATKLIVEEAGGKVTDLHGKEQRYDSKIFGAIITNGKIHDELVRLLSEFGPEKYVGY